MTSNELNAILNKTRRTPNISLTPKQVEELVKDLELLEKQDKVKLMLKQKQCVLRYVESEDCFAVRCILDENWYKLSKDFVENNIKEEVKPTPLINKVKELKEKVEKQDKILSILKNKKVDIKLVLWAGQKVEAYNVEVRERKYFPRAELTQKEFDDIREWLNGKD